MKKFFKKKAVMFGSIVAAAVVLVLLVAFCVRPVSVGYTYKNYDKKTEITTCFKIKTFNKLEIWTVDEDGDKSDKTEMWYFVKDGLLAFIPSEDVDKDEWKEFKEEAIKDWNEDAAEEMFPEIDAFGMEMGDEEFNCAGAVATVVVLAVLEVALLGAVAYAVLVSKKK